MKIERKSVVNEAGSKLLVCVSCEKTFAFPPGEQEFFRLKGFPAPSRCKPCRADRREQRQREQSKATLGDVIRGDT